MAALEFENLDVFFSANDFGVTATYSGTQYYLVTESGDQVVLTTGTNPATGADIAEDLEIQLATTVEETFTGIFDNPYLASGVGLGVDVQVSEPTFHYKIASLTQEPREDEQVVINSVTYRIKRVEKDRKGTGVLVLERQ